MFETQRVSYNYQQTSGLQKIVQYIQASAFTLLLSSVHIGAEESNTTELSISTIQQYEELGFSQHEAKRYFHDYGITPELIEKYLDLGIDVDDVNNLFLLDISPETLERLKNIEIISPHEFQTYVRSMRSITNGNIVLDERQKTWAQIYEVWQKNNTGFTQADFVLEIFEQALLDIDEEEKVFLRGYLPYIILYQYVLDNGNIPGVKIPEDYDVRNIFKTLFRLRYSVTESSSVGHSRYHISQDIIPMIECLIPLEYILGIHHYFTGEQVCSFYRDAIPVNYIDGYLTINGLKNKDQRGQIEYYRDQAVDFFDDMLDNIEGSISNQRVAQMVHILYQNNISPESFQENQYEILAELGLLKETNVPYDVIGQYKQRAFEFKKANALYTMKILPEHIDRLNSLGVENKDLDTILEILRYGLKKKFKKPVQDLFGDNRNNYPESSELNPDFEFLLSLIEKQSQYREDVTLKEFIILCLFQTLIDNGTFPGMGTTDAGYDVFETYSSLQEISDGVYIDTFFIAQIIYDLTPFEYVVGLHHSFSAKSINELRQADISLELVNAYLDIPGFRSQSYNIERTYYGLQVINFIFDKLDGGNGQLYFDLSFNFSGSKGKIIGELIIFLHERGISPEEFRDIIIQSENPKSDLLERINGGKEEG